MTTRRNVCLPKHPTVIVNNCSDVNIAHLECWTILSGIRCDVIKISRRPYSAIVVIVVCTCGECLPDGHHEISRTFDLQEEGATARPRHFMPQIRYIHGYMPSNVTTFNSLFPVRGIHILPGQVRFYDP